MSKRPREWYEELSKKVAVFLNTKIQEQITCSREMIVMQLKEAHFMNSLRLADIICSFGKKTYVGKACWFTFEGNPVYWEDIEKKILKSYNQNAESVRSAVKKRNGINKLAEEIDKEIDDAIKVLGKNTTNVETPMRFHWYSSCTYYY